jgi:hypothetical protein
VTEAAVVCDGERVAAIYAMRNPDKLRRMPYTAR